MAIQQIVSEIRTTDDIKVEINPIAECGQIVIQCTDTFTQKMKDELIGILFKIYNKVDSECVLIDKKIYLWNSSTSLSIPVFNVPDGCYLGISPVLSSKYQDRYNTEILDTVFPVVVSFDDTDISTTIDVDDVVTPTGQNPVSGTGIYTAIQEALYIDSEELI